MDEILNILITAGGTSEKIDEVRHIANSGTGRLGAMIAETFAASARELRIDYLCSADAVRPMTKCARVTVADDVMALKAETERLGAETRYDIIVHSMAVGDYRVRAVTDAALLGGEVIERLSCLACGESSSPEEAVADAILHPPQIKEAKISSDKENLIVVLEKAPKIIALLRGLAPEAVIVGFKLLANVDTEELLRVGHALLVKNDCDFVLANDMNTVRSDRQEGFLIAPDRTAERAAGKGAIADLIVRRAFERLAEKRAAEARQEE